MKSILDMIEITENFIDVEIDNNSLIIGQFEIASNLHMKILGDTR